MPPALGAMRYAGVRAVAFDGLVCCGEGRTSVHALVRTQAPRMGKVYSQQPSTVGQIYPELDEVRVASGDRPGMAVWGELG